MNYGGMSLDNLAGSFSSFGFSIPIPAIGHVFSGFEFLAIILVTAIPFGIYDLVETIDDVESASAAGDSFPTTRVLTADGFISLIGCLMGNLFILAVYIGHPGWKSIGGRIDYSAATGIMVILLSWQGIIAVMMSLIPIVAIAPILLYIGMLIGAQAFQETPKSHAPAVMLTLIPHVAAWGKLQIDNALAVAGTNAAAVGFDKLGQVGILYKGLETLGGGAILTSLVLGQVKGAIGALRDQFPFALETKIEQRGIIFTDKIAVVRNKRTGEVVAEVRMSEGSIFLDRIAVAIVLKTGQRLSRTKEGQEGLLFSKRTADTFDAKNEKHTHRTKMEERGIFLPAHVAETKRLNGGNEKRFITRIHDKGLIFRNIVADTDKDDR